MFSHPITIWAIDDEQIVLDEVGFLVQTLGFDFKSFTDPTLAEAEIEKSNTLVLVILDHDFSMSANPEYKGYDFGKKAKYLHWTRCVLPIIYLTGREDRKSFDLASVALGGSAPDDYLHKTQISELPERIHAWADRLHNFQETVDEHGREVALTQYCERNDF